jgi:GT2 family glycosyltransferase
MSWWGRYLLGVSALVAVLGLGAASLGADLVAPDSPLAVALVVLDARVLLGVVVAAVATALGLYLYYLRTEDPSALVDGGPDVEALVPVYGDSEVLHRSVEGLVATDYEDLTVTVVVEPDDDDSRARATELAAEHPEVRCLVNRDRRGSKAGALNTAIEGSDADVIGMFDADQEPHPKLVSHAVATLEGDGQGNDGRGGGPRDEGNTAGDGAGDDGAEAVRVRSLPRPAGGLVESEAYYEYLLLFFLPQKLARAVLGLNVVGTRSVFVERTVFERVGRFDEGTLTEDMDFTHRCHQAGVSVRELLYYPAFEQPAHTLGDWWGQRIRWMTGHAEVGHAQLRDRAGFDADVLGSLATLCGTFLAGVVLATTVPKLVAAGLSSPWVVGAELAGLYGLLLATRSVDNRTAGTEGVGLAWLLLPVFLSLYGLAVVRALVGYALGWDGEWYRADKRA